GFKDVSATRGYDPPRIHLGAPEENPTLLTRQDWRGPRAGWKPKDLGYWEVQVARKGTYNVTLLFPASEKARTARFALGGASLTRDVPAAATRITFEAVRLPAGPARLEGWLVQGDALVGVSYMEVFRKE